MEAQLHYSSGRWYGWDESGVYEVTVRCETDGFVGIWLRGAPDYRGSHNESRLLLPKDAAAKMALVILAQTTGPPGKPICFEYDERDE